MPHLHAEEGAKLIVTDIDPDKVRAGRERDSAPPRWRRTTIYDQAADIYAPCALGATINDDTLARLKVEIIAGGANNQLAEERHGDALEKNGILYAPDYVINGGGVINVYGELHGWPHGAREAEGRRDLRHDAPDLRHRQARADSVLPRRPTGWRRSGSPRWQGWIGCGWVARRAGGQAVRRSVEWTGSSEEFVIPSAARDLAGRGPSSARRSLASLGMTARCLTDRLTA